MQCISGDSLSVGHCECDTDTQGLAGGVTVVTLLGSAVGVLINITHPAQS